MSSGGSNNPFPSSGSGSFLGLYAAGVYYAFGYVTNTIQPTEAAELVMPMLIGKGVSIDRLAISVITPGSAGSLVRLGIRSDNGRGYPGNLLLDAGTVDATIGGVREAAVAKALVPGLYWLSTTLQGAAVTRATLRGGPSAAPSTGMNTPLTGWSGGVVTVDTQYVQGYGGNAAAGALPQNFVQAFDIGGAGQPTVWVRFV